LNEAISNDFKQEFEFVTAFYQNDLQPDNLLAQLVTLNIILLTNWAIHPI